MADLLPTSADEVDPTQDGDPRVLGVDSDDAEEVLDALSAATARRILGALHEDPATPSEVAERADTSLQNAQYHLEKLVDADLIRAAGTRYSEKGREMTVYAPADGPLVLFAGSEERSEGVRAALTRLLGAVGVLGLASLLVQRVVDVTGAGADAGGEPGGSGAAATTSGGGFQIAEATTAATTTASSTATQTTAAADRLAAQPGLLFFAGGLLVVVVLAVWRRT